ncbi:MAG: SusC/RagA family protein, partial [Bacteroides sp.]
TKGKGVEFTINTTNLVGKDYEWNTTLTMSRYSDKWAERSKYWKPKPYEKVKDYKRAWWSKEAIGILQPGEAAPAHQPNLLPGMVILKDQNGDGKLDQNDDIYMGNGDPKLIFGLNNTARYKNFDFNIYLYGELGRTRLESYYQSWTSMKDNVNVSTHAYKSFSHDNLDSKHPTFLVGGDGWGSHYKKNVSYVRVGSITLGYTVPIPSKIAKSLRVYLSANNPFVFTNWKGLDPETDNGSYPYPNIRSYNFGASITF